MIIRSIDVSVQLDSLASIWGFRFEEYVAYQEGKIVAVADDGLDTDEGIVVMAAFDSSLSLGTTTSRRHTSCA